MLDFYSLYCESQEKLKRKEYLLNMALSYIFDVVDDDEEYLRICKDSLMMTPAEIAEEKAEELLELLPQICSLDAPAGEDATLQQMLENLQSPQPYEELVRAELISTMNDLLAMLSEREQQVLRLHFGMTDDVCYSLEQIGKILGVSKERARQIERQALQKMQKLGADIGLEDFLE